MHTSQQPVGSGFGPETTAEQVVAGMDLAGKVVVITGGASGLGLEVTKTLSGAGATTIVGARDPEGARHILAGMAGIEVGGLDLAEPDSVAAFAEDVVTSRRHVEMMINNAGVMALPLSRDPRGFETHLAVNYLGHFELTRRLWPALIGGPGARVVNVTSRAYRFAPFDFDDPNFRTRDYEKWAAYGQSMSAKALFTVELDARGRRCGVRAFAVHPGTIMTNLARHLTRAELIAMGAVDAAGTYLAPAGYKSIPQGAATTVWAATSPQLDGLGGVYLDDCDIAPLTDSTTDLYGRGVDPWLVDPATATSLWAATEQLLGVSFPAAGPHGDHRHTRAGSPAAAAAR